MFALIFNISLVACIFIFSPAMISPDILETLSLAFILILSPAIILAPSSLYLLASAIYTTGTSTFIPSISCSSIQTISCVNALICSLLSEIPGLSSRALLVDIALSIRSLYWSLSFFISLFKNLLPVCLNILSLIIVFS